MATKDQILNKFALDGDRVVLKAGAEFDPGEKVQVLATGELIPEGVTRLPVTSRAPRTANDQCTPGQSAQDDKHFYYCGGDGRWLRGTLKTWEGAESR